MAAPGCQRKEVDDGAPPTTALAAPRRRTQLAPPPLLAEGSMSRVERTLRFAGTSPPPSSLPRLHSSFSRARPPSPSRVCCLRGERQCDFASPLSSLGSLPSPMPCLLESAQGVHSCQREAKMLLPPAVGPVATRPGKYRTIA
jgi:hypothetical protein